MIEVFAVLAAIIAKGGIFSWLVKALPGLGQAWLFENPQRHLIVDVFWAAGFGLFLYGLSSALAITMSLLRVTQSLDKYHATEDHKDVI